MFNDAYNIWPLEADFYLLESPNPPTPPHPHTYITNKLSLSEAKFIVCQVLYVKCVVGSFDFPWKPQP